MKRMFMALGLVVMASPAFADNCDTARNTYDAVYCDGKVYASADNELNKNYQLLRSKLNAQQKGILKKSQLAWIRDRDDSCTDRSDNGVYTRCQLSKTQERNSWLRERIRECQTIGCKTSSLSN